VNTAKYQAFLDYKCECDLNTALGEVIERLNREPDSLLWRMEDSQLRITERRIAYQEHDIEQKKMKIPDYEEAYTTIWCNFDELGKVLCEEGKRKHPRCDADIDEYIDKKWCEVMEDIKMDLLNN
jgi:hypothetical protein